MAYLDDTGLAYFWGKIKAYIAALLAPKANDADVVHKTGNEYINGAKVFGQPSVILQSPDAEVGANPSDTKSLEIFLADKNYDPSTSTDPAYMPDASTRLGELQWQRRATGVDTFEITLREVGPNSNILHGDIGVSYNPTTGIFHGYCPSTPEQRTNGSDIVTRDWIPKDTRIVHTTGNETIAGQKTFAGTITPLELYRTTTMVKGDVLPSFFVSFNENINDTVTKLIDYPVSVIAGGADGAQGLRLGSIHGITVITSGEVGSRLSLMQSPMDIATISGSEDIYLMSDKWIYFLTDVNQDTGGWQSQFVFTNTRIARRVFDTDVTSIATTSHYGGTQLDDQAGNEYAAASLLVYKNTNVTAAYLEVFDRITPTSSGSRNVGLYKETDSYDFKPSAADINLGYTGSRRWKQLYATTTTISTSDARQKTDVADVSGALLDAWENVRWSEFKFRSSVAEKGSGRARTHVGIVAQQVQESFGGAGVAPDVYGFFCHDSWDATEDQFDESGRLMMKGDEAGDEYSVRYEEALCIEAAWQRRENVRLRARLAALEDRLAALELRLGSA